MSLLLLFSRAPGPVFMEATIAGVSGTTALLGLGLPLVATVAGDSAFPLARLLSAGSFVVYQHTSATATGVDEITVTLPSVPPKGHILLGFLSVEGGAGFFASPPVGWGTFGDGVAHNGTLVSSMAAMALSDGTEDTWTFETDAPTDLILTIMDIGGIDLLYQAEEIKSTGTGTSQGLVATITDHTGWQGQERLLVVLWSEAATTSYTPDSRMAEIADRSVTGLTHHVGLDMSITYGGGQVTRTATAADSGGWAAYGLALYGRRVVLLDMAPREVATYVSKEIVNTILYQSVLAMEMRVTVNVIAMSSASASVNMVVEQLINPDGGFVDTSSVLTLEDVGAGEVVLPVTGYSIRVRATVAGDNDIVTFAVALEFVQAEWAGA